MYEEIELKQLTYKEIELELTNVRKKHLNNPIYEWKYSIRKKQTLKSHCNILSKRKRTSIEIKILRLKLRIKKTNLIKSKVQELYELIY